MVIRSRKFGAPTLLLCGAALCMQVADRAYSLKIVAHRRRSGALVTADRHHSAVLQQVSEAFSNACSKKKVGDQQLRRVDRWLGT